MEKRKSKMDTAALISEKLITHCIENTKVVLLCEIKDQVDLFTNINLNDK